MSIGRLFYLLEHDPGGIVPPGTLLSSNGFTFDGGVILAALLIAGYVLRTGLSLSYLDAVAVGLPLGVAVGRIGDVINGEHYGPRSDFFLAVRNANPDALTPNPHFAYQNGGLYEVLLAAANLRLRMAAASPPAHSDFACLAGADSVCGRSLLRVLPALGQPRARART